MKKIGNFFSNNVNSKYQKNYKICELHSFSTPPRHNNQKTNFYKILPN